MKKTKPTFTKLPKADLKRVVEGLRYRAPENIFEDFTQPEQRAAIAAVFQWLGLNGFTAWALKQHGQFTTIARSKSVRRDVGAWTAVVISRDSLERAEALLDPKNAK
jgi:hypothetical protein